MIYKTIQFVRRNGPVVPFIILMTVAIGLLTYFAGTLGVSDEQLDSIPLNVETAQPPPLGTPAALFAPLDPAIIDYLAFVQPDYQAAPLDVLVPDIPVIGAYLPRSGNTLFELTEPTPLPTSLPYPTSPPLPLPPLAEVPTVSPLTEDGTPRVLPFDPENTDCSPGGFPVEGVLTQQFHIYHIGIDIGVQLGTPVLATHSGQVIYANWSDIGYGYLVIVQSGPFITYYGHNTSFNVSEGQMIGKGSIIAWSGSTGNSTGPHVHYETRINDVPVDPLTFENRGYASC